MLAAEQGRLANRTRDIVKSASARATQRSDDAAQRSAMQQAADGLAQRMSGLSENAGPEGPWLDRAKERMRDAADALRTGDLSEARSMARQAHGQLEQAAASLEQDARMFPGHNGETARRAAEAAQAGEALRQLEQRIGNAMPDLSGELGAAERGQMRGDVPPQQGARKKADELGKQLGQTPDEGAPLSPMGERGLGEISEAMRRAEQALEQGDAKQASLEQDDARSRLDQLAQQLQQRRGGGKPQGQSGRQRGEGDDGNDLDADARVRIPGADEFQGPKEQRRRLLDAMREAAPTDYEAAVQRYYQELLR